MTRYLSLLTFTDQGVRNVKDSIKRAASFRGSVEEAGGKVVSQYWAIGEADGCVVFETPDEEIATALLLVLSQAGNVRTRTIRVYDESEFSRIVGKV